MTDNKGSLVDIVNILKTSDFFKSILPDDLYWLASKSSLSTYNNGSVLFRPGEVAKRFFMIKAGTVAVSRLDSNAKSEEMARFVSGDTLGDFDFSRSATYDAEAVCLETSLILLFPAQALTMDNIISEKPDVAARILLRAVIMISSRVRSTQALISDNAPWVRELRRQMYTDAATGLWSRNFLDDELTKVISPPLSLVLIKPDHFKELCDTWTHSAGDFAMERLASILKTEARSFSKSWAIRLRSNETAIIVSTDNKLEVEALTRRLAQSVNTMDLSPITGNTSFKLSASIAFSFWPEDENDFKSLFDKTYASLMSVWKDGGARAYRFLPQDGGTSRL